MRENKTTYHGQGTKEESKKKKELNIDELSAGLSGLRLQRKQCLVLKIQSVNQQKMLDDSDQLKSLEASHAMLFLKLTNAFGL